MAGSDLGLGWDFYISLICSIGGVIFFVISLIIVSKIKDMFPGTKLVKKYKLIQMLIILFLLGYVFNIIFLALKNVWDVAAFMGVIFVAIVYIFGGLFVLIVINLSYKTYKTILSEPKK